MFGCKRDAFDPQRWSPSMRWLWVAGWSVACLGLATMLPIPAIALGVLGAFLLAPVAPHNDVPWMHTHLFTIAIVLLGFSIQADDARHAAAHADVLLAALLVPLFIAGAIAKRWGLAVGSAICGASAIAASKNALQLDDGEASRAIASVGLLGTLGLLLIPAVALAASVPQDVAGLWAGATLHAVPQAVGAGYAIGEEAGQLATTMKLARVAFLPVMLLTLAWTQRQRTAMPVPKEVIGFTAAALVAQTHWLSGEALDALASAGGLCLLVAIIAASMDTRIVWRELGTTLWVGLIAWLATSAAVLWLL